ncbi:hypothetical protein VP01_2301g2 [Puccinia sorghi]|uniref:Uncharacterized protein n=1 Tax=Puccinia sorghi TaxID=27349 RepID=A0A0L6V823_9BASI|nr:hypothetical protein VP01_2301g2 [Puccinia sorghi]
MYAYLNSLNNSFYVLSIIITKNNIIINKGAKLEVYNYMSSGLCIKNNHISPEANELSIIKLYHMIIELKLKNITEHFQNILKCLRTFPRNHEDFHMINKIFSLKFCDSCPNGVSQNCCFFLFILFLDYRTEPNAHKLALLYLVYLSTMTRVNKHHHCPVLFRHLSASYIIIKNTFPFESPSIKKISTILKGLVFFGLFPRKFTNSPRISHSSSLFIAHKYQHSISAKVLFPLDQHQLLTIIYTVPVYFGLLFVLYLQIASVITCNYSPFPCLSQQECHRVVRDSSASLIAFWFKSTLCLIMMNTCPKPSINTRSTTKCLLFTCLVFDQGADRRIACLNRLLQYTRHVVELTNIKSINTILMDRSITNSNEHQKIDGKTENLRGGISIEADSDRFCGYHKTILELDFVEKSVKRNRERIGVPQKETSQMFQNLPRRHCFSCSKKKGTTSGCQISILIIGCKKINLRDIIAADRHQLEYNQVRKGCGEVLVEVGNISGQEKV